MNKELKQIQKSLAHLEWGESIINAMNSGEIRKAEIIFTGKDGKEVYQCPVKDDFQRKRLNLSREEVKNHLVPIMHRLRHDLNGIIVDYAKEQMKKRKDYETD